MSYNTIGEATKYFVSNLQSIYPKEEIRNFVYLIFNFKCGFSKIEMLMNTSDPISEEIKDFCDQCFERLKQQEPIQYILGETEFYGLTFKVNPHVLIPRPETEELVQWIIVDNQLPKANILDIGTGSGCIPVTLKTNIKDANVSAWDISESALGVAKENAILNRVNVNFKKVNALLASYEDEVYDVIVSNPPYVTENEKELMQDNVLDNEPHLALFVSNNDPLLFYRKISEFAINALKPKGCLYFEINEAFGLETADLMKSIGFKNIEIRKDLFGKDRMVKGVK